MNSTQNSCQSTWRWRRAAAAAVGLAAAMLTLPSGAQAPASSAAATAGESSEGAEDEAPPKRRAWQYDPYRIHAWVAVDEAGGLGQPLIDRVAQGIRDRSPVLAGATWKADAAAAPSEAIRVDMLRSLERMESDDLFALYEGSDDMRNLFNAHDKLMLIAIRYRPLGFQIVCRELDIVTRQLGLTFQRETRHRDLIERQAFEAMAESFRAVVKIEEVKGKDVEGLVRAGGLVVDEENPSRVGPDSVLVPVIRSNDRLGQPRELNGIRLADWSFLLVGEVQQNDVLCRLHTGLLNPLGGRAGSRIQKFGLQIRPRSDKTVVRFMSKLEKGDPPDSQRPLAGYEIRDRHPNDKEKSRLLGQTNWNGEIEVPLADTPLRLVFVQSGGMLLASFPTVPGFHPELVAEMPDDEGRLRAEAFIQGMQRTIMDTVAKRQVIAKKIDKLLAQKKLDEAEALLAEFRALVSITEMNAMLDRSKSEMRISNRRKQAMVDQMFAVTRELISTYLGDKELIELEAKLNKARG